MNRNEYMESLEKHLKKFPKEEKENALVYYNEYFDDAGIGSENKVIAELGSPVKLAAQLRGEYALRDDDGKKKTPIIVTILLAIFAAPIALPLALSAAVVVFALLVVVFALLFSFAAVAAALLLGGAAYIILAICVLFQSPATTIFFVGVGLLALGLGLLLGVGLYKLIPKVIGGLKRWAAAILEWRKKHEDRD